MSIHYQSFGQGEPLLIIHGLFGTSDNLKNVANKLSDTYTVYLIDAPAHGNSTTVSPLDLPTMAQAVRQFCHQQGLTSVAVLGHSMGGKIAMELAIQNPGLVTKLVVADIAPVKYPRRHDHIIEGLKSVTLDSLENRKQADTQLSQHIAEGGIRSFLLKSLVQDPNQSWQWKFDLSSIEQGYENLIDGNSIGEFTGETLFLVGGNSNYVQPEHKEQITGRFKNLTVKVIQNAGHWLHAEKPTAFVKICRDFLAQ